MKTGKIVAGITAAALSAMALSFAAAADEPTGYVSFTAIKSTIGQGFTVEPVNVPLYEGDKGIDIVKRAVGDGGVVFTESDYGEYVTGFADVDTGAEIPAEIAAVCPEMTGRNTEGYLSAYDYTAESGWSYFINGEYAQVGITDYEPQDGDVLEFRYTVYGYGADLGIDNSGWGGAAALTEQVDASQLIKAIAEIKQNDEQTAQSPAFVGAVEILARYGADQSEIDQSIFALVEELYAAEPIAAPLEETEPSDGQSAADDDGGKGSPDTGIEGAAAAFGVMILACGAVAVSRKTR
ncbi:MAG: DUF4430 domain-containing protein [Oscillospiraceae bacterium]|nr:DUF4430 domain-containing protein [Oscillospiraceae bacterium]